MPLKFQASLESGRWTTHKIASGLYDRLQQDRYIFYNTLEDQSEDVGSLE